MKKIRKIIAVMLFIVCGAFFVTPVNAQSDVPLLVLRYNQPRIYYDKQLYSAVSKAVAIKPTVTFSLVSFVPAGDGAESAANAQTNAVVASLQRMGIPRNHINVSNQSVDDSRYHEIYLYVD
jgi:uncharacterized protein YggE